MRLIDADMLIEMLRHDIDCYDTGKPDDKIYINAKDVINMIKGQPTAHDVDRVVGQLEECKRIMESPVQQDCFSKECEVGDCSVCAFDKAISIVKAGGAYE